MPECLNYIIMMQTIDDEPKFSPGSTISTPFRSSPVTVTEYDVHNGSYDVEGPSGGHYRLVIVESGYKWLYTNVPGWEYNRGSCGFDEVEVVDQPA